MRSAEFGFAGTEPRPKLVDAILRGEKTAMQFAIAEREGFESVADWRSAHERFWASYWGPVDDDTLVVAERFRVV